MAPIAISNRKPGFVPFSAQPLTLAGQAPRRPQRQAFKPAPYRPPVMLANRAWTPVSTPRMAGLFSMSDVPLSLTLGLAGAGAMILSGVVPSPVKEVAIVAGLGLIGFGLINLFSGEAAASSSVTSTGAKPFTAASQDQFNLVSAKIIKPSWNEEVNRGLFSSDYPVEVLWTNNSDKPVSVPYRVYVEEDPHYGVMTEKFQGVAYTGIINLAAGQSVQVPLQIDLQYRALVSGLAVGVTLKIQKVSSAGQVFDADTKSFVVY